MQIGYDNAPVALSTDHRTNRFHHTTTFTSTNRRRIVRTAMTEIDLLERLCTALTAKTVLPGAG